MFVYAVLTTKGIFEWHTSDMPFEWIQERINGYVQIVAIPLVRMRLVGFEPVEGEEYHLAVNEDGSHLGLEFNANASSLVNKHIVGDAVLVRCVE
jgi:hypothetical protein